MGNFAIPWAWSTSGGGSLRKREEKGGHVVVPSDIVREHGPSSQRLMRPLAMLTCFNISPIEGSVFLGKKKLR